MTTGQIRSLISLAALLAAGLGTTGVRGQECAIHTDCLSCILDSLCGWCDGACKPGHDAGPDSGSCASWAWTPDECGNSEPNTPPTNHTYYLDADGDGYGDLNHPLVSTGASPPAGYVTNNTDPDDHSSAILPAGAGGHTYYRDADGDGFGDPNSAIGSGSGSPPSGYTSDDQDPGDHDPNTVPSGAILSTYYKDADDDGYGDPNSAITSYSLSPPLGYVGNNHDPADDDAAILPAGSGTHTYYADADGDHLGDGSNPIGSNSASPPAGYVSLANDSNDNSAADTGNTTVPPIGTVVCPGAGFALLAVPLLGALATRRSLGAR